MRPYHAVQHALASATPHRRLHRRGAQNSDRTQRESPRRSRLPSTRQHAHLQVGQCARYCCVVHRQMDAPADHTFASQHRPIFSFFHRRCNRRHTRCHGKPRLSPSHGACTGSPTPAGPQANLNENGRKANPPKTKDVASISPPKSATRCGGCDGSLDRGLNLDGSPDRV